MGLAHWLGRVLAVVCCLCFIVIMVSLALLAADAVINIVFIY